MAMDSNFMGQEILNPPTVEGWHTGREWIDSGTLLGRVNFAAGRMGNVDAPGIRNIIERLGSQDGVPTADRLVDGCLELLGAYELAEETRGQLVDFVQEDGVPPSGTEEFSQKVSQILQLIVATQEYQFA